MIYKQQIWGFIGACALAATTLLNTGCKGDDDPEAYDVPTSYSFDNVNYSGQTTRMDMLEEMADYMSTANTSGTALDAQVLKNMYANQNAPFSDAELNNSGKDLKSKTFSFAQDQIEAWLDSLAVASTSTVAGSNGVAGVVSNGSRSYLCSASGKDYAEIIEKGLMGACLYYQITAVYLSEDKIGPAVDNTNVTAGEGTDMEHHWDEAFGYFGVPMDFPANTNDLYFIGKYCNSHEDVAGLNSVIMDAYLTGRAAISNDDMETKDAQVAILRSNLELVFAATAIHYLNGAKANIADDAMRNHMLSEAAGFIRGLQYNPVASVSTTEIDDLLNTIGDNFYTVSTQGLDSARDTLASIFNLEDIKELL